MSPRDVELVMTVSGEVGSHVCFHTEENESNSPDVYLLREIWQSLGCPLIITMTIESD